ncbi:hypothetical protein [Thermogymnomonas acidicola]|uniref:hypothetical protein n=1 Tax=Thermogymnomonas acidicola TaxID=399579 RepID=UPI0009467495|nr:hypothetical protein [Thermogymnomonas acidicola]
MDVAGSEYNLSDISTAQFSGILINGTAVSGQPDVYTGTLDYLNMQNYSSVNVSSNSAGYLFSTGVPRIGGAQGNGTGQIEYWLAFGNGAIEGHFHTRGLPPGVWYVNGTAVSTGYNMTFPFSRGGGIYLVTYSAPGVDISRYVAVPYFGYASLNVSTSAQTDRYEVYNATVDYFYHYTGSKSIRVAALDTSNSVSITAKGEHPYKGNVTAGEGLNVTLMPYNVTVTLYVSPGTATVDAKHVSMVRDGGFYTISSTPQEINLTVSASGYYSDTIQLELLPGRNVTEEAQLEPLATDYVVVQGAVEDALYHYPVVNANVSLGSLYVYTNGTGGNFTAYVEPGTYSVRIEAPPLYRNLSSNETFDRSSSVVFYLQPQEVNVSVIPHIYLLRNFPFLFYFAYVSWSQYTGSGFQSYTLYISNSSSFTNYTTMTITSQKHTYVILDNVYPGKTYYAMVIVRTSNGQIFGSGEFRIGYTNIGLLALNVVIVVGIVLYVTYAVRIFRKRKRYGE